MLKKINESACYLKSWSFIIYAVMPHRFVHQHVDDGIVDGRCFGQAGGDRGQPQVEDLATVGHHPQGEDGVG